MFRSLLMLLALGTLLLIGAANAGARQARPATATAGTKSATSAAATRQTTGAIAAVYALFTSAFRNQAISNSGSV